MSELLAIPVRREMSNAEKGMIVAFYKLGMSIAQIAIAVNRPWSTVKSFTTRYIERKTIDNAPRSGRPLKFLPEEQDAVIELI